MMMGGDYEMRYDEMYQRRRAFCQRPQGLTIPPLSARCKLSIGASK